MAFFSERYRALNQILCWILALHLLNYSIDPRDPEYIPEGVSFNEIESIAELIFEVIGLDGVFEEFDEHDMDGGDHADSFKFFCSSRSSTAVEHSYFTLDHNWAKAGDNRLKCPYLGILVPPPKSQHV